MEQRVYKLISKGRRKLNKIEKLNKSLKNKKRNKKVDKIEKIDKLDRIEKNHKTVKPEKFTKNYNWKNGLIFLSKWDIFGCFANILL